VPDNEGDLQQQTNGDQRNESSIIRTLTAYSSACVPFKGISARLSSLDSLFSVEGNDIRDIACSQI